MPLPKSLKYVGMRSVTLLEFFEAKIVAAVFFLRVKNEYSPLHVQRRNSIHGERIFPGGANFVQYIVSSVSKMVHIITLEIHF